MDYLNDLRENVEAFGLYSRNDTKLIEKIKRMIIKDIEDFPRLPEINYVPPVRRDRIMNEDEEISDRYAIRYKKLKLVRYNNYSHNVDEHWRVLIARRKKYSELILQEGSDDFIHYLLAHDLIIELPTTILSYEKLKNKIGKYSTYLDYSEYLPTDEYFVQELDDLTSGLQKKYQQDVLIAYIIEKSLIKDTYIRFMLTFPELFSRDSYNFLIQLLVQGKKFKINQSLIYYLELKNFLNCLWRTNTVRDKVSLKFLTTPWSKACVLTMNFLNYFYVMIVGFTIESLITCVVRFSYVKENLSITFS